VPKALVFSRDVGGTRGLIPVVKILQERKFEIKWVAQEDGGGKDILSAQGIKHCYIKSPQDIKCPDLIVSSACSGQGVEAVRFFNSAKSVVVQDQRGAGLKNWSEGSRPSFIFVNDNIDVEITFNAWRGYKSSQIIISGYPALDSYADFNTARSRNKIYDLFKIDDGKPAVLFAGVWWETGHAISELVESLNALSEDVYLIPRLHPGMKDETPEELPLWEESLAKFRGVLIDTHAPGVDIRDLISVSNLVVSIFSTVLTEAAILRKPNIAILYPDRGMKIYRRLTGLNYYPMVSLGCTDIACNRIELMEKLQKGISGSLDLSESQGKVFKCDGKNSERIADFIEDIIQ